MPHPERAVSEYLANTDGRVLFQQIFNNRKQLSSSIKTVLAVP
jgi:hypothetical protein